jgi:hypothetical protein
MDSEIKNFVGIYDGAFSDEYCDTVVKIYDALIAEGFGWSRQDVNDMEKTKKDDHSFWTGAMTERVDCSSSIDLRAFSDRIGSEFNKTFWDKCYPHYAKHFAALKDSGQHSIYGNKIQKTGVGQGYHVWHYEAANRASCNRLLTYIVYLNDVEEGGETELLYYPMRIKPKKGTCIIFPAAYTHTHRGNPPISNTKYILTGWVEF